MNGRTVTAKEKLHFIVKCQLVRCRLRIFRQRLDITDQTACLCKSDTGMELLAESVI